MENKSQLKLSKIFSDYLSELPETGMGYQIVDIELKNGNILKDYVVLNSTYLKLKNNENIENAEIKMIKLK